MSLVQRKIVFLHFESGKLPLLVVIFLILNSIFIGNGKRETKYPV